MKGGVGGNQNRRRIQSAEARGFYHNTPKTPQMYRHAPSNPSPPLARAQVFTKAFEGSGMISSFECRGWDGMGGAGGKTGAVFFLDFFVQVVPLSNGRGEELGGIDTHYRVVEAKAAKKQQKTRRFALTLNS